MGHAQRSAEGHDAEESGGNRPERASAQLRRPEANGKHGEQMIEPAERVNESVREPCAIVPGVGVGQDGNEQQRCREEKGGRRWAICFHGDEWCVGVCNIFLRWERLFSAPRSNYFRHGAIHNGELRFSLSLWTDRHGSMRLLR